MPGVSTGSARDVERQCTGGRDEAPGSGGDGQGLRLGGGWNRAVPDTGVLPPRHGLKHRFWRKGRDRGENRALGDHPLHRRAGQQVSWPELPSRVAVRKLLSSW